nr:MAG: ORF1 [TTV-like mini virus]
MPYYYRRRQNRYRRRRWFRPWRPRGFIRYRRRRWRKQRRVRRKLKRLSIKEWQPQNIKKCCIKGLHCLFYCNKDTLQRNFRMYEHSINPEHIPGGGGFSITKYSLDGLYEQHQLDRNWWTQSNYNLPMARYLGGYLKCYQSKHVDYLVKCHFNFPMLATQLLYQSCQPSFMMMSRYTYFIPSKETRLLKKGYKKIKLHPPQQMSNKWFFQRDLCKTGLVLIQAVAASFDEYYIGTYNTSNNCTLYTLNPHFWKRHDFIQPPVDGYTPYSVGTTTKHLWTTHSVVNNINQLKANELIYLGLTQKNQQGQPLSQNNKDTYFTDHKNWGNPFKEEYLTETDTIYVTTEPMVSLKEKLFNSLQQNSPLTPGIITTVSQQLLIQCRYSPDRDTGEGNKMYLKNLIRDTSGWEEPSEENLITEGFPLWTLAFGFLDWHKKLGEAVNLYRSWVIVIQTKFIEPELPYYILLDSNFIHDTSPYQDTSQKIKDPDDENKWYPSCRYQQQSLESLVQTGPGIYRFHNEKTVQAKLKYNFYFKFGGCVPKMDTVHNPCDQAIYPIPNQISSTCSLQNPAQPPETFLYQFDVYKDLLTKAATKRISKDWQTETSLSTGQSRMQPTTAQKALQEEEASSDEEKDPQKMFLQLQQYKRERRLLEYQLQQLLGQP